MQLNYQYTVFFNLDTVISLLLVPAVLDLQLLPLMSLEPEKKTQKNMQNMSVRG